MLNHARTLLLNIDGDNNPGPTFFGEEAVPGDFRVLELPSFLVAIRQQLFGSSPDRSMMNYRLWQFLRVLHATEDLAQYVTAFDPRITYVDSQRTDLFDQESFQPEITQLTGAQATLSPQDGPASPDIRGRVYHQYLVEIITSATVRVTQSTVPVKQEIVPYTFTDGLSSRVDLFDSGWGVLLGTNSAGTSWKFTVRNRPTFDLGQLVVMLGRIGEPVLLELFGLAPDEPFKTFKNLWEENDEIPFKLGGLLLALITRTDEVRSLTFG
jgi:hypothetical protein